MLQEVIRISRVDFQRLPVLSSSSEGQTSGRTGPWIYCPASAGQAQGGRGVPRRARGGVLCKVARRVRGLKPTKSTSVLDLCWIEWTEWNWRTRYPYGEEDWPD